MVLKTPEYARQSDTFLRATEDLVAAAKTRIAAPRADVVKLETGLATRKSSATWSTRQ